MILEATCDLLQLSEFSIKIAPWIIFHFLEAVNNQEEIYQNFI